MRVISPSVVFDLPLSTDPNLLVFLFENLIWNCSLTFWLLRSVRVIEQAAISSREQKTHWEVYQQFDPSHHFRIFDSITQATLKCGRSTDCFFRSAKFNSTRQPIAYLEQGYPK